jgi:hypothetical protein
MDSSAMVGYQAQSWDIGVRTSAACIADMFAATQFMNVVQNVTALCPPWIVKACPPRLDPGNGSVDCLQTA